MLLHCHSHERLLVEFYIAGDKLENRRETVLVCDLGVASRYLSDEHSFRLMRDRHRVSSRCSSLSVM